MAAAGAMPWSARVSELIPRDCRILAAAVVRHYREAMRRFAERPILDVWYARFDVDHVASEYLAALDKRTRKRAEDQLAVSAPKLRKARTRSSLQAIRKLTVQTPDGRRLVGDPPLVIPLAALANVDVEATRGVRSTRSSPSIEPRCRPIAGALLTRASHAARSLLDHYVLTDIAHKVVGVGSVGLRAWILLMEAGVASEGLLLQAKQAVPSALADQLGVDASGHQGARVVTGQRVMQASSDIFLGWLSADVDGQRQDYYLRQLRDWKVSAEVEQMNLKSLSLYARMCGWTLARAHARAGDRVLIASYLGRSTAFDDAVAEFAVAYADQNERDHQALQRRDPRR